MDNTPAPVTVSTWSETELDDDRLPFFSPLESSREKPTTPFLSLPHSMTVHFFHVMYTPLPFFSNILAPPIPPVA